MKKKLFGLLALSIIAINGLMALPAFAGTPSNDTSALQGACSALGGHFSVTNGSSSGLSWTCNGASLSGTTKDTGTIQSACSTLGGSFSVSNGNSSGVQWTCQGAHTSGTASNGNGGGGGSGGGSGSGTGTGTGTGSGSGSSSGDSGSGSGGNTLTPGQARQSSGHKCGGVSTSMIDCSDSSDGSAIFEILGIALNIATYGVGAAAVLGVIITGYQYMSARDNSAQVVKAKNRLLQVVIGLVIWILFWGVLQFLLPGGLFADGSK